MEPVQYLILKLLISVNTIVLMSQNHRIVKSLSYFWRWIHQERWRTVSTLMYQLTGANFVFFLFRFNNILSGMIILKNDVIAILSEKINSKLARNGQSPTFPPGPDKQISLPTSHWHISKTSNLEKIWSSKKSEVISLRTSGKRLPGKKLAIYVAVVISVLVLSFNLTRNLSFIVVSDKEGVFEFI